MSRLRASTAPSDSDRQIAEHLDRAERELESAIAVARQGRPSFGVRARRTERDLGRALGFLQDISTMAPRYSAGDPDSMSEEERNRLARVAREEKRLLEYNAQRQQERAGEVDIHE